MNFLDFLHSMFEIDLPQCGNIMIQVSYWNMDKYMYMCRYFIKLLRMHVHNMYKCL